MLLLTTLTVPAAMGSLGCQLLSFACLEERERVDNSINPSLFTFSLSSKQSRLSSPTLAPPKINKGFRFWRQIWLIFHFEGSMTTCTDMEKYIFLYNLDLCQHLFWQQKKVNF